MNSLQGQDNLLRDAFEKADHQLRIRHTKVACVLTMVLVPAGSSLDYFVYPDLFWPFFQARLLCDLIVAPIFLALFTSIGQRYVRFLTFMWFMSPVVTISWMIYASQNPASPYYAGLNLIIFGSCLLLPFTILEAVTYFAMTVACYLAACIPHELATSQPGIVFNNVYFIVLTSVIAITARHFSSFRQVEEFRLRHELDHRNKELAKSNDQLAEMDRLKSEFFANVNHELRTPLTLILSPVEMLLHRDPPLPEKVGQSLTLVRNNGLRLLKLINDMLEVLRLEQGRLMIDAKPMDVVTFVSGIVDSMRYLASSKQIQMTSEGDLEPLVVRGDRSRLEKVLLNLLTNAIKFTDAGGSITVRWLRKGESARIEVQDTGIGIPAQELPHVFDRFRQADGSSTRKYQGVGLGLALSKELIQEHGGILSVQSQQGEGTTISVELPIDEEEPVDQSTNADSATVEQDPFALTFRAADRSGPLARTLQSEEMAEVGQGTYRILVVDDEPDMRKLLISTLVDDYRVLQAGDGINGLAIARETRPDLILLDLMLPGMDGLDVCRELRKHEETKDCKVVLLTARVDEGSKIEALERGADDFLTKPFNTVEVKTRLKNMLRTAALQKDLRRQNTELEETLVRLKKAEAQLIQSEKMNGLGSLAAGLLHEINNPLNYTMAAVQLLQQSSIGVNQDLKEMLDDIDGGMRRIRDILTDLRAFAYPEQSIDRQQFKLEDALNTAMRFTSHMRNGQSIEQELVVDCPVVGSKTQISQVLVNLLANAQHAVDQVKDGRVRKIGIHSDRTNSMLCVRLSDNGVGIDPKVVSRIFDPFFTTKPVGEGMGLGLSICHTIITNHGGSITIDSREHRGTEVTFELPLADAEN